MRVVAAGIGLLIAACSNLPTTGDGVVAIEVLSKPPLSLTEGDSLLLQARALDQHGEVVADAPIIWRVSDTTLVAIDSLRGMVTARSGTGSVQVQATTGTLRSDPLTISLRPAPTGGLRGSGP